MPINITKSNNLQDDTQPWKKHTLHDLDRYVWDADSIDDFRMDEALENHPLSRRPTNIRSKLAYADLLKLCKPTKKYLLPGQLVLFAYQDPKYKEELEYYDATPVTLFIGITRTKDGNIREIGLNLHYFPPRVRYRILNTTYEVFKDHFKKCFNDPPTKPSGFINWKALKHMLKRNLKVAFGVKMYIPVLRGSSYVLPTRLFPTAAMTEGHFNKATLAQVQQFWRQFR